MVDTFTKAKRSQIMRAVRSQRNKSTEEKLIQLFKQLTVTGWRRNFKLFGKPDFVFPKKRVAIFTDGCFWHGHDCRNTSPSDNRAYWQNKIARNKDRDRKVSKKLRAQGWHVYRLWECNIGRGKIPSKLLKLILD